MDLGIYTNASPTVYYLPTTFYRHPTFLLHRTPPTPCPIYSPERLILLTRRATCYRRARTTYRCVPRFVGTPTYHRHSNGPNVWNAWNAFDSLDGYHGFVGGVVTTLERLPDGYYCCTSPNLSAYHMDYLR